MSHGQHKSPHGEHPTLQLRDAPPQRRHLIAEVDDLLRPAPDELVVPPPREQHAVAGTGHPLLVALLDGRVVGPLSLRFLCFFRFERMMATAGRKACRSTYVWVTVANPGGIATLRGNSCVVREISLLFYRRPELETIETYISGM